VQNERGSEYIHNFMAECEENGCHTIGKFGEGRDFLVNGIEESMERRFWGWGGAVKKGRTVEIPSVGDAGGGGLDLGTPVRVGLNFGDGPGLGGPKNRIP